MYKNQTNTDKLWHLWTEPDSLFSSCFQSLCQAKLTGCLAQASYWIIRVVSVSSNPRGEKANRVLSRQTFWFVKAEKAQVEFKTLMVAAFHLGELVPGLWRRACSLSDFTYWDCQWNGDVVNFIGHTCAFPALTRQNFCRVKGSLSTFPGCWTTVFNNWAVNGSIYSLLSHNNQCMPPASLTKPCMS